MAFYGELFCVFFSQPESAAVGCVQHSFMHFVPQIRTLRRASRAVLPVLRRGGGAGGAGGANVPPKYRLGGPCPPNPKMATATSCVIIYNSYYQNASVNDASFTYRTVSSTNHRRSKSRVAARLGRSRFSCGCDWISLFTFN